MEKTSRAGVSKSTSPECSLTVKYCKGEVEPRTNKAIISCDKPYYFLSSQNSVTYDP